MKTLHATATYLLTRGHTSYAHRYNGYNLDKAHHYNGARHIQAVGETRTARNGLDQRLNSEGNLNGDLPLQSSLTANILVCGREPCRSTVEPPMRFAPQHQIFSLTC